MKNLIKLTIPYLIAGLILIATNLVFFAPQLIGKVLQQSDMISVTGMAHEAKQYFETTGKPTHWTNAMFGGMPTYQIYSAGVKNSIFDYLATYFNLGFQDTLGYYLILTMASFLGLCFLGIGPWLSMIGAFSIAFASNHVGLASAGHLTKIATLGFVPLIIVGTYLLFNKNWKLGFAVFSFGLAACIHWSHIQMTYYTGMILAFYVLAEIVHHLKQKKINSLIRPGLCLLLGVIIACVVNYSILFGLNSYAKDTMRGGSILSTSNASNDINTASGTNGLGWDYAMQWSNGFSDLLSTLVPGFVGGSSNEGWSLTSKIAQTFRQAGMAIPKDFKLPLYWGNLPFTSGPDYLGILLILTFILAILIVEGPFKWFALFSSIFLILQSMGKNLEVLNHFLFNYLPYYNKFRTPNSILNVLSTIVPIFSMYGLYQFIQTTWTKESLKKIFYSSVLPLAGILIFIILFGPTFFGLKSSTGADSGWEGNVQMYTALIDTRASYLRSDAFRSLVILLIGGGLLYYVALKKLKLNYFYISFGLMIFLDLFSVAKRYVDRADFESKQSDATNFKPRPVDLEILKDKDLYYRVLDLSINTYNSAIPSYFHKTIGGYSPVKLRRYQDMIDYYLSKGNLNALNMLNTKYIIDQKGQLQINSTALGNAWFVSSLIKVNTPDEEIKSIAKIDPAEEAVYLASEFNNLNITTSYQKNGSIKLLNYYPDRLIYQSNSTSNQLAVFSEVWYGPDKGWLATIDGKPVEHFRVNYILRALSIPAGDHKIEFIFDPKQLTINRNISFYSGMIYGLFILAAVFLALKKSFNNLSIPLASPHPPIMNQQVSSKAKFKK